MKDICLGTALWGWAVEEKECFSMLDTYYDLGYRFIDTAYNYPINSNSNDLSVAPRIISKWINYNRVSDLKIIHKIGSTLNDMRAPNNLNSDYLISQTERAIELYEATNLECSMIHWDTRNDFPEDSYDDFLYFLKCQNVSFGLSGVKSEAYRFIEKKVPALFIEAKFNPLHNGMSEYDIFQSVNVTKIAYGISVSGLKLDKNEYSPDSYVSLVRSSHYHDQMLTDENVSKINSLLSTYRSCSSLYELGITICENSPLIDKYIIAPRNMSQFLQINSFRTKNFQR